MMATLTGLLIKHGIPEPRCASDLPEQWAPRVDEMFAELIAAGWDRRLDQIKEKCGGLRVYIAQRDPRLNEIIELAESDCAGTGRERGTR